ncbi:MAG: AbrB/MazE/SpoVT family DNA-binding domain-containing protein [Candidatus Diapherotrites archaeon]
MKRKVIRQGHNTFTVTIPIRWARQQGLSPGSEIDLVEKGNSLVINTDKVNNNGNTRAEIDITGLPNKLLWRYISAVYRAGYDEIKINFDSTENNNEKLNELYYERLFPSPSNESLNLYDTTDWFYRGLVPKRVPNITALDSIQALVNRFIGVEIIEQKQGYVVVKQLGEISYKEFDNALKRIFMLLISMGKDVLEAIEKNDFSTLRTIHMIDTNIDRFQDYCFRVFNVKGYEEYKKTPTIYSTIFLLELVGDEYKIIAQHVTQDKHKYKKNCLKLLSEINSHFESYYSLFCNFELKKAVKIFEREDEIEKNARKLYEKCSDEEKELLHHLKKIARLTISLVELAIDLKAEKSFEPEPPSKTKR